MDAVTGKPLKEGIGAGMGVYIQMRKERVMCVLLLLLFSINACYMKPPVLMLANKDIKIRPPPTCRCLSKHDSEHTEKEEWQTWQLKRGVIRRVPTKNVEMVICECTLLTAQIRILVYEKHLYKTSEVHHIVWLFRSLTDRTATLTVNGETAIQELTLNGPTIYFPPRTREEASHVRENIFSHPKKWFDEMKKEKKKKYLLWYNDVEWKKRLQHYMEEKATHNEEEKLATEQKIVPEKRTLPPLLSEKSKKRH